MSLEASEINVAGSGHVWTAALASAFPTNISSAVDETLWNEHGFTTVDGVHITFDRQTKDILGWQVRESLRTIITSVPKKIDFTLLQLDQNNLVLAAGGGTVSGSNPNFLYTPPSSGTVDERAGIVEWTDDVYTYRLLIQRWLNKAPMDFMLRADDASMLPISMSVLAPDSGSAWTLQTNDPNVGLAASSGS